MKKYFFVLFLFLKVSYITSQVVISGQIKNVPPSTDLKIAYSNNTLDWNNIKKNTIELKEKGKFKIRLNITKPCLAKIVMGELVTDLFLSANDSLYVTFDCKKFDETIQYKGTGANNNNFMAADLIASDHMLEDKYNTFNDVNRYLVFEDSLIKAFNALPQSQKTPEFSTDFRNYLNSYGRYRFIYPRWKYYKIGGSKHYFDFLKELNLSKPWDADKAKYRSSLSLYLAGRNDSKTNYELPDGLTEPEETRMEIRKNYDHRKDLYKDTSLEYVLTGFLENHVGEIANDSAFTDELLNDYRSVCKNPKYVTSIEQLYTQAQNFRPGKPAPDFALPNMDGQLISLSSLKGKVVYIDFWATWCGPCMNEMPGLDYLMKRFGNDTNMVFLNVNIRDNMENWKQYITKENMKGITLYANNSRSSEIQKKYKFNSIPRYVLIDKNGNLISINAPRPWAAEKDIMEAIR